MGRQEDISRRELESLLGLLNHACIVIRCGCSFVWRMLDLLLGMSIHPQRPHLICLNREFRSDLAWWRTLIQSWNGVSYLSPELPIMEMASDASGSWECGAWHFSHWFQWQWGNKSAPLPIMVKELFPILFAVTGPAHRVHSPSPGPSRGLDLSVLAPVVQRYFQAGLPVSSPQHANITWLP